MEKKVDRGRAVVYEIPQEVIRDRDRDIWEMTHEDDWLSQIAKMESASGWYRVVPS